MPDFLWGRGVHPEHDILLILGLAAAIMPIATTKKAFQRDETMLIGASVLLLGVALSGTIGRTVGMIFVMLLGGYTAYTYLTERSKPDAGAILEKYQ